MLIDIQPTPQDPTIGLIMAMMSGNRSTTRQQKGVYICPHHNFSSEVPGVIEQWPDTPLGPYGVCDSVEQFIEKCVPVLEALPECLVVGLTVVLKSDQPDSGGWRWHKWGEYIGDKSPQHEYLYDEGPDITQAVCFHICQVGCK